MHHTHTYATYMKHTHVGIITCGINHETKRNLALQKVHKFVQKCDHKSRSIQVCMSICMKKQTAEHSAKNLLKTLQKIDKSDKIVEKCDQICEDVRIV